jgi:hypothetical protein
MPKFGLWDANRSQTELAEDIKPSQRKYCGSKHAGLCPSGAAAKLVQKPMRLPGNRYCFSSRMGA